MRDQKESETFGKKETIRRRDEALKRALNTPPKPHKPLKKSGMSKRTSPKK